MRARFIGDPNDGGSGPQTITVWDHEFTKGEWRRVSHARFAKHSHFEFDGDGDGEADPAVEEMRAELIELGVKIHHKAGPAKIAELYAEARAGKEAGE